MSTRIDLVVSEKDGDATTLWSEAVQSLQAVVRQKHAVLCALQQELCSDDRIETVQARVIEKQEHAAIGVSHGPVSPNGVGSPESPAAVDQSVSFIPLPQWLYTRSLGGSKQRGLVSQSRHYAEPERSLRNGVNLSAMMHVDLRPAVPLLPHSGMGAHCTHLTDVRASAWMTGFIVVPVGTTDQHVREWVLENLTGCLLTSMNNAE